MDHIQKCVEIVYEAETVSLIVILGGQVDSSISDDRGEMITTDGDPMVMEDALVKLFPMLLGIHPMSPVQGYQPDVSFVFQRTNVAEQLRNLGLWSLLASHISDLIGPL